MSISLTQIRYDSVAFCRFRCVWQRTSLAGHSDTHRVSQPNRVVSALPGLKILTRPLVEGMFSKVVAKAAARKFAR